MSAPGADRLFDQARRLLNPCYLFAPPYHNIYP